MLDDSTNHKCSSNLSIEPLIQGFFVTQEDAVSLFLSPMLSDYTPLTVCGLSVAAPECPIQLSILF